MLIEHGHRQFVGHHDHLNDLQWLFPSIFYRFYGDETLQNINNWWGFCKRQWGLNESQCLVQNKWCIKLRIYIYIGIYIYIYIWIILYIELYIYGNIMIYTKIVTYSNYKSDYTLGLEVQYPQVFKNWIILNIYMLC